MIQKGVTESDSYNIREESRTDLIRSRYFRRHFRLESSQTKSQSASDLRSYYSIRLSGSHTWASKWAWNLSRVIRVPCLCPRPLPCYSVSRRRDGRISDSLRPCSLVTRLYYFTHPTSPTPRPHNSSDPVPVFPL